MHTDQLEYFVAIAEQGSFTEASYELSISQSSLSKQINKLEEELNVKLFVRGRRQLMLTDAGRDFLVYARDALRNYRNICAELLKYSSGGTIHIGSVDHMGKVGLTTPMASFIDKFPENSVHLEVERSSARQVVEWLLEGRADICFTARIADGVRGVSNLDVYDLSDYCCSTLLHDEYYVIVPEEHEFCQREYVDWEDLREERLMLLDRQHSVNALIREAMISRGMTPHVTFECNQTDALLRMVADGFGITFLSGRIAASEYEVRRIPLRQSLSRDTYMIVPQEHMQENDLTGQFAHYVEKFYEKNSGK